MFKLFRPIRHLIGAGTLLFLTALSVLLAKLAPKFWFSFYTDFSRGAMRFLGAITGWIPFPLWEILLILLVLAIPVGLIVAIKQRRVLGWLTALLEGILLLVFLFVGLWGLNHFAPGLDKQIGLEVKPYTTSQITAAAKYYAEQADYYAALVDRDENGDVIFPEFSEMNRLAAEGYKALGAELPRLSDPVGKVKPLLFSDAFAYMGTTGIFICFTGEAGVSTSTYIVDQPFTICHEMSHSLAFAAEDEANYCAFLACRASDSPVLNYSGYYSAFFYCYNALKKQDAKAAEKLWKYCSDQLKHDSASQYAHDQQYEGPVQSTVQKANDGYLKTFQQEEGVQSYGLVADYLIADYLQQTGG